MRFDHPAFPDHALLDSGGGEKLERFGAVLLRRPDPQAVWRPRRSEAWQGADLVFERDAASGGRRGRWVRRRDAGPAGSPWPAASWTVGWGGATFVVRPTPFKHLGLFPEQACNWEWVARLRAQLGPRPSLLNLFGYTGAASVLARRAGYEVTHVDASKTSLAWARENAAASGLPADALRLVLDDALAFARREVRRGARYEGLLLDPPHHGRGPRGQRWQFEIGFAELMAACRGLLAERSFLVLSTYAIGFSPLAFENALAEFEGGRVCSGELALPEEPPLPGDPVRYLPAGFCARWWRGIEGAA